MKELIGLVYLLRIASVIISILTDFLHQKRFKNIARNLDIIAHFKFRKITKLFADITVSTCYIN